MAITKLSDVHGRRKSRNVGLGLTLGGFVLLVLILSMVKIAVELPAQRAAAEAAKAEAPASSSGKFEPAEVIAPKEEVN